MFWSHFQFCAQQWSRHLHLSLPSPQTRTLEVEGEGLDHLKGLSRAPHLAWFSHVPICATVSLPHPGPEARTMEWTLLRVLRLLSGPWHQVSWEG